MTTIVIDRLNEEDFRRSIENRLRESRADAAIERLRKLLAPYAGSGRILPERFLTVTAADLVLKGWDALDDAVRQHDRPGRPVTALSIAFGWPGEKPSSPEAEGHVRPHVETRYFTDDAFPFSQSGREDLLEGYSFYGCTWGDDSEAADAALSVEGIDDLHGALAALETQLLACDEPDEDGIRAGSLGSCLLSALLFQAVGEQIKRDGLPRPLCVMAGSSGVYPYFDAPVVGMPEEARKEEAVEAVEENAVEITQGAPAPRYSSLLMTGIPRAKKRAVLVLEESEAELANRIARLRSLPHGEKEGGERAGGEREDSETQREAIPAMPTPDHPDPAIATVGNGPLLARKPAGKVRDVRNLPGLPDPEPCAAEPEPCGKVDLCEPTLRAFPDERLARHAFTPFELDVQERLNSLLSGYGLPVAETPVPAPPAPAHEHAPLGPSGLDREENDRAAPLPNGLTAVGSAPPAPPGLRSGWRTWLWRRGLLRYGAAPYTAIARFLKPGRDDTGHQSNRMSRILQR